MKDGTRVELDTRDLDRGLVQLMAGINDGMGPAANRSAQDVAGRLRPLVPVRTGRLRNTVKVTQDSDGAAVHYGGSLPYAGYIDGRTHATDDATQGAGQTFYAAMRALGAREVGQL